MRPGIGAHWEVVVFNYEASLKKIENHIRMVGNVGEAEKKLCAHDWECSQGSKEHYVLIIGNRIIRLIGIQVEASHGTLIVLSFVEIPFNRR